jgi:hypothetical protein
MKLLTREQFRTLTLNRNNGNCVVQPCDQKSVDAHHILNRNLFIEPEEFGGYFLENGSGLCSKHHLLAEQTLISTPQLYEWCEIIEPAIPVHLEPEYEYDTWGNIVINEYERIPGELFNDEGCQKALTTGRVLWMF